MHCKGMAMLTPPPNNSAGVQLKDPFLGPIKNMHLKGMHNYLDAYSISSEMSPFLGTRAIIVSAIFLGGWVFISNK
jgi:hypothetical protein